MALVGPVDELQPVSGVAGIALHTPEVGSLGTVEAVAMGPGRNECALVIVGHGGLRGIGEAHVAVPRRTLDVTPGLLTVMPDTFERRLADAPAVGPARECTLAVAAEPLGEMAHDGLAPG